MKCKKMRNMVPFYIPISYNIERNEKKEPMVTAVGELGECERNGYLMGTGKEWEENMVCNSCGR